MSYSYVRKDKILVAALVVLTFGFSAAHAANTKECMNTFDASHKVMESFRGQPLANTNWEFDKSGVMTPVDPSKPVNPDNVQITFTTDRKQALRAALTSLSPAQKKQFLKTQTNVTAAQLDQALANLLIEFDLNLCAQGGGSLAADLTGSSPVTDGKKGILRLIPLKDSKGFLASGSIGEFPINGTK